jgi:alpha-D-ribose 1-methylphosphonate 5-triphosphate synthase subunit PhnI
MTVPQCRHREPLISAHNRAQRLQARPWRFPALGYSTQRGWAITPAGESIELEVWLEPEEAGLAKPLGEVTECETQPSSFPGSTDPQFTTHLGLWLWPGC